jgi:DNA-binding SARP family transcriptional activator/Flp pilus assembly protein TadD
MRSRWTPDGPAGRAGTGADSLWGRSLGVRFTILGPVEVSAAGRRLPQAAPRHRAVLAYLLLHAQAVLSADRLIDAVWGQTPPDTARAQIHAAVTAIRRVLRVAGAEHVLVTRAGGYVALPEPGQLDLEEFTSQVAAAQAWADAGDRQGAAREIRAALTLWRGQPFADVNADYVPDARARLDSRRLAAFEHLADLELSQGRHEHLIDELAAEVAAQPLRERLSSQLMLALHRAGRQADALSAARAFRAALAEQQGLDPSRAFAALEQAILRDDPGLDHRPVPAGGAAAASPKPATDAGPGDAAPSPPPRRANYLPYDTPDFAGRSAELDRLTARQPHNGGVVTISAIDGMAGIGKTALAIRAAHRLADRYPDAQLFIDLQAHTAEQAPLDPGAALETLLRQLGVPAERIPASVTDRAALWRAELADLRVLAVLDNAAGTGQVRPLLPGASSSLVLITSRRRLTGLDGAHALSVDLLPAREAVDLFTRIVGERAAAEPMAVLDVLHLCGFLPLAIRISAARLHHRPQWTVGYLASRLRDQRRRLTELSTSERGVAAAFTLSYQQLDPSQQRMFRLLGLHPGRDIDAHAAAALADVVLEPAETLLEDLLDAHVVAQHEPGRYTFHDLLRDHARATAATQETTSTQHDALTRLLNHYLHTASTAINLLYPARSKHLRPRILEPDAPIARFSRAVDAAEWLAAERANLIAAGTYAADHDWPAHTSHLAATLHPYLYDHAHHAEALTLYTQALDMSRRLGDKAAEARTLIDIGWVDMRHGRYEQAAERARRAFGLYRETEDRFGQARAQNMLGIAYERQGRYEQAHQHLQQALDLYRKIGERVGETHAVGNLGIVYERQGRYEQAYQCLQQALDLYRELGDRGLEEAIARSNLGLVYRRLGRYEQARAHHRQALKVFRELGNRSEQARALNGLGEAAQALGDLAQAADDHDAALALAREVGSRHEQARAHASLARAHHDLGHIDRAREHAQHAVDLYVGLGVPEADEARSFLASLR